MKVLSSIVFVIVMMFSSITSADVNAYTNGNYLVLKNDSPYNAVCDVRIDWVNTNNYRTTRRFVSANSFVTFYIEGFFAYRYNCWAP